MSLWWSKRGIMKAVGLEVIPSCSLPVNRGWRFVELAHVRFSTNCGKVSVLGAFQGPVLKFQVRVHKQLEHRGEPLEYFGLILHNIVSFSD